MALDRKFAALQSLNPDIAIVPECANLDILRAKAPLFVPNHDQAVWAGDNPTKGLGIFAYNGFRLRRHPLHDHSHRIMIPIEVSGVRTFHLLAVWSFNDRGDPASSKTTGALVRALTAYEGFCRAAPLVVAGDFNNNVIWDKPSSKRNHAQTVGALADLGLVSAYHHDREVVQGGEMDPTHYWRDRKKDGPRFHIDYIFLPQSWAANLNEVIVGTFEEWCGRRLSDHVPLVADINLEAVPEEAA
jgi:exodeoxyribonuclease-3